MTPTPQSVVIGFIVLGAAFWVLQRLFPSISGQKILRQGYGTDVIYWVFQPLIARPVIQIGVAVALVPLALYLGTNLESIQKGRGTLATQPAWAQAIQVLLLADFIGYWQHRLFHRQPLWRFHAIHHSSTELDWLSSARLHPVNEVLSRIFPAVAIVGLGYSPLALAIYLPVTTLYAVYLHANVGWSYGPLRYAVASPTFHRWHHTSEVWGRDKNFAGLFPIWDLLCGTFYMPIGEKPHSFGVADPVPSGFLGQMIFPFRRRRHSILAENSQDLS